MKQTIVALLVLIGALFATSVAAAATVKDLDGDGIITTADLPFVVVKLKDSNGKPLDGVVGIWQTNHEKWFDQETFNQEGRWYNVYPRLLRVHAMATGYHTQEKEVIVPDGTGHEEIEVIFYLVPNATSVAAQDDRITVALNYNYNWNRVDLGVFAFDTPVYGTGVITINGVESEFSTTLQPDSNFGVDFAAPLNGTAKVVFKYRFESQGLNNMELNRSISWDDEPFVVPPPPMVPTFPWESWLW